jgi:hypothetical protein
MTHLQWADALPIGCNSRRTEQLLGRINLKSPTKSGKLRISGYFRHGRGAVFRRNLADRSGFKLGYGNGFWRGFRTFDGGGNTRPTLFPVS